MNTGWANVASVRPNDNASGFENIVNVDVVDNGDREIVVKDTSVKCIRNKFENIACELNEQHPKVGQQRHLLSNNKSKKESSDPSLPGTSKQIQLSSDKIRGCPSIRSSGHKNKSTRINANILTHRTCNSPKNSPRQNRLMTQYFSPNTPGKKKKMNVNDTIKYFEKKSMKDKETSNKKSSLESYVDPLDKDSKEKVVEVNVKEGEENKVVNAFNLLMQRDDTLKETSGKLKKSSVKEKTATEIKKSITERAKIKKKKS